MTENPVPTFRDNKDRAVYLLAEFKWPILAVTIALGIWAAFFVDKVPTPPQSWLDFAAAWGLLAFPLFIYGRRLAKWLYHRNWVTVGIIDGSEEKPVSGSVRVPPDTWQERTETGASALDTTDSDWSNHDFVVQKFNWYEDVGELEIRGFARADMDPDQQFTSAKKVGEYYEYHHVVRRLYTNLKERVHDKISEVHDATMMQMLAERERGETNLDVQVTDLIHELEDEMEDLPDAPGRDTRPEPQKFHDIETMDDIGTDIDIPEPSGVDQTNPQPATDGGERHE